MTGRFNINNSQYEIDYLSLHIKKLKSLELNYISAIKNGDSAVFQEVFDLYHTKLYFFILSKTRSAYLTEEIVQLTFIKFWKYRNTLKEDCAVSTQVFRIALTTMIDLLRKQNNLNSSMDKLEKDTRNHNSISLNSTIEHIDEKELYKKVTTIIKSLPPVQQKVFTMSREEGMSYKEIATELCISTRTVEVHISKALKKIRKAIPSCLTITILSEVLRVWPVENVLLIIN